MSHLLFNGFRIACRLACFVWCLLFIAGCITAAQLAQNSADTAKIPPGQVQLKSIDLKFNPDTIDLLINGNGKMKYSAVKQDFPLGVMVYLHDTVIADKFTQPSIEEGKAITSLSVSYVDDAKKTVAVKILLNQDLNYHVQENEDTLTLVFYKKGGQPTSSGKGIGDEQTFTETDIFKNNESSSSSNKSYNKPALVSANAAQSGVIEPVTSGKRAVVTGIDFHSGDDGESSIVINTSHPIKYEMERSESNNELRLSLYNTDIPEHQQRQLITTYFNSAVDKIVPVDRSGNEAASKIHVVLRERVPYHILQEQNRLTLFMEPSSVKPMKLEAATPTIVDGRSSSQVSHLATSVSASQVKSSETLELTQTSTNKSSSQQPLQPANSQKMKPEESEPEDLEADTQDETADENSDNFFEENPVFTGEEISLDFYETDIKNVFRILQTVSGENFAVDKDVTGTVTLTLEKPAPWDEILNLILKMNGLGKIKEGSIVRIATMQTIKKEEDEKAALFAAKALAQEQKKQQEPMFTEYIPINYANADADIKPHIEKLLTPKRDNAGSAVNDSGGKVSVDKRTNMIILTDTRKKIDEVKQLIYRLDKVTAQVMISARIVEVTKDFSRELGVNWGLTDSKTNSPSIYRDDLGGLYGYDIAVNPNVASAVGSTIGYTFSRLAGTPLLLDARLTASEETGDLKVISSPKILTLDNKEATISQGFEVPYPDTVDNNGNVTYSFKKIDLSLIVKPQVTPDKRISMTLKITKNELAGFTDTGIPYANTNEANTELLVNDGNTIVIGGIVKSTISETMTGVPLLSDIPYFGKLFRQDASKDTRNELLLFITPSIVQLDQKDNKL
ncbi:MAG: type IV pilus secretin PilQ [Desulfamplus sp.]|nr:type IV pilus secretin PilQ [Desulfamplus sp.]MBF0413600.1 type IV pilus secretin PilQ [Desulfamplus sp.]